MIIGWDTETYLLQSGIAAPKLVCGSWSLGSQSWVTDPDDTVRELTAAIKQGHHIVGCNIAFDVAVMAAHQPKLLPLIFLAGDAGLFHDIAIREALHDIARDCLFKDPVTGKSFAKRDDSGEMSGRYSLALLHQRYTGENISAEKTGDVWRYSYAKLDGVPLEDWPAEAIDYPKRDASRTLAIFNAQAGHSNLQDEAAQVRAAIALRFTSTWGFRTDETYLNWLESKVDAEWHANRQRFTAAGIYREDGTKDTKRLQHMVWKAYKSEPPHTEGDAVSTDRDTLLESGDETLIALGSSGKNDKRKTTYVPALRRGTAVPVNPEYNVLVNTGRVSSDWQQMPQKGGLREAIIARPGFLISSCDYNGLELRTMSERCILDADIGFSKMADYLNSGKDAHSYVAGFFLGLSLEEFEARKTELKAYRDVAKIFNFGAGGGAGAAAIAYGAKVKDNVRLCLSLKRAERCGQRLIQAFIGGKEKRVCAMCVEIAKELKVKWLKAWPEQGKLAAKVATMVAGNRKVNATVFGSGRVRGGCGYSQVLNTPFQGAAGDGMKRALWNIVRESMTEPESPLWGSRVFLQVHDELLTEHPEALAHEAALRVARIMVAEMDKVTIHVKNEVTPALMRRVFKSATAVYDKQGRLKPWWPDWTWEPDSTTMKTDGEK